MAPNLHELTKFFCFFPAQLFTFFLAQPVAVRAQTAEVEFLGTFDSGVTESCRFSGVAVGALDFEPTSKRVSSTEAAQIKAVIQPTTKYPLSKFFIKAGSPSLTYKSGDDTSGGYRNVQTKDLGIGLGPDDQNVNPSLGVKSVTLNPTSQTSNLLVGVIFETELDVRDGDYRAASTLTCFIAAS
ncbi:hypothetical protein [Synechococcus sp. A15-44]|uniref:hypothetical protein n=1 Tax=Synechococcus sp. A15-44 TaxID=1050646 RepID=UPI0016467583|nr:hypothetical protein [Synechococcus sp. A15-44]